MKQIKEILKYKGTLSQRKIAKITGVSRPTVAAYMEMFEKAGLDYQTSQELSDSELLEKAKGFEESVGDDRMRRLIGKFPDYLKRIKQKGMTLGILWEEYKSEDPDPYGYSRFCEIFQEYRKEEPAEMHIEHKAGDKAYFDFAGEKLHIKDRETGESREVEFFVGILGASQLTYAEAVENQKSEKVIQATENAFRYFGGVPSASVFDCLKAVVTTGHRFEPKTNAKFDHFLDYYDSVNLPARPLHPKDKALVEGVIKILYTRLYTELRKQTFFSLEDLNREIRRLLEENHNNIPLTKIQISRRELFETTERQALKALPNHRYEIPSFADVKVQPNYHVYFHKDLRHYSVPHQYRGKKARIVATKAAVEVYIDGMRICTHQRDRSPGFTTKKSHLAPEHRFVEDMNPEKLLEKAKEYPPEIQSMVHGLLDRSRHPNQGSRWVTGIFDLAKKFGNERVARACDRAIYFENISYTSVKEILDKRLESYMEDRPDRSDIALPIHENIRGADYYKEASHEH